MEPFKPPEYIAGLIAAINDGAKAAQTGALASSVVGLYLVATAVSTTDEDLLLEHTTSIAQLGVQVPVVFSFAIAPLVFVALHVLTLTRFDLLAANLRHFLASLDAMVPLAAEQENCRHLLANVEFVLARVAPRGSSLQSRMFRWVAFGIIAVFPVAVLMAIEVSALRYQSDAMNWAQRGALAINLLALVWFFRRQRRAEIREPLSSFAWLRLWIGLLWAPAAVLAMSVAWLSVPDPDETSVRWDQTKTSATLRQKMVQPLDMVLCPSLGWGCRFLTVDHRTLVGRVWKGDVVADLRAGSGDTKAAFAAVEGVFLRRRTLRFAKIDESWLFGADLISADLRRATLSRADLSGAHLNYARLEGANLGMARLEGAVLSYGQLEGANLSAAHLEGADLSSGELEGVNLIDAELEGVNLIAAHLEGAHLNGAHLEGANLINASLQGADLTFAHLEGAYLSYAQLQGTGLYDVNLSGADLSRSKLWQALYLGLADAGLADFRAADFAIAIPEGDQAEILRRLSALPGDRQNVKQALSRGLAAERLSFKTTEGPALVQNEDVRDQHFDMVWAQGALTTDEAAYQKQLVPFLADQLASRSPAIATGLALYRALGGSSCCGVPAPPNRALASRLLTNAQAGKIKFADPSIITRLQQAVGSGADAAAQAVAPAR